MSATARATAFERRQETAVPAGSPVPAVRGAPAFRQAQPADAAALHGFISAHLEEGHLLPRTFDDLAVHARRFLMLDRDEGIGACGELAPLSRDVAEIRSFVVARECRGAGVGRALVDALRERAQRQGFTRLCVFTHQPAYFARMGFSIVPHAWLPEKIAVDCCSCPLFRRCGQFGMLVRLQPGRLSRIAPAGPHVVDRGAAEPRRAFRAASSAS